MGWRIILCDRPMDSVENSFVVTKMFSGLVSRSTMDLRGHRAVRHEGADAPKTCRAQGGREMRCENGCDSERGHRSDGVEAAGQRAGRSAG
jgi:hypothetical protein